MTVRQILAVLFGYLLLFTSCIIVVDERGFSWRDEVVRGSGNRVEETRDVGSFSAVALCVPADVVVEIGAESSISLSGDDNLLERIEIELEDGTLLIREPRGTDLRFRQGLDVRIVTPELSRFGVEGSGHVEVRGLRGERFHASIEGSGAIVAAGEVDSLKATIVGSGDLKLGELTASEASVSIEGSGDIGVHVTRELCYEITGSGDIRYEGAPHVSGGISGSGSVRRR